MGDATKGAGSKLYIGTNTVALASESTWVQVGELTGIGGELGGEWRTVDTSVLTDVYDTLAKTTINPGSITVTYNLDLADDGQEAMAAAYADARGGPYNFKVAADDDAAGGSDAPTTFTFRAKVLSNKIMPPQRQNVLTRQARLAVQTAITEAAAA